MSASPALHAGSRHRLRALAALAATLAGTLIWLLADAVLDVDVRVPDGPGATTSSPLALPVVIVAVAVVSLAGWGLLAVLERFSRRARTVWIVVAVGVLVLSLFAPLFAAGLSVGNRITLVCLHLAVGAILVPAFTRGVRRA